MKLTNLSLSNFRIFKNQSFDFKKLTVLTGANSSGKSSILHSIASILQTNTTPCFPFNLKNNGDLVSLGGYKDIVNGNSSRKKIGIGIKLKSKKETIELNGKYRYSSSGNHILLDETCFITSSGKLEIKWGGKSDGYKIRIKINSTSLHGQEELFLKMFNQTALMLDEYHAKNKKSDVHENSSISDEH